MEDLVDYVMVVGDEVNFIGIGDNRVVVIESWGGWKD